MVLEVEIRRTNESLVAHDDAFDALGAKRAIALLRFARDEISHAGLRDEPERFDVAFGPHAAAIAISNRRPVMFVGGRAETLQHVRRLARATLHRGQRATRFCRAQRGHHPRAKAGMTLAVRDAGSLRFSAR